MISEKLKIFSCRVEVSFEDFKTIREKLLLGEKNAGTYRVVCCHMLIGCVSLDFKVYKGGPSGVKSC